MKEKTSSEFLILTTVSELGNILLCRDSQLKTVLQEVTQADIPTELSERLAEEKRIETVRTQY